MYLQPYIYECDAGLCLATDDLRDDIAKVEGGVAWVCGSQGNFKLDKDDLWLLFTGASAPSDHWSDLLPKIYPWTETDTAVCDG
jgi:hypothetical protein